MNAVYARQSVDRRDSISIESQIDGCVKEMNGGQYRAYIDRGFSGKNTNRPQFKRLMEDIKSGEISSVYVYKLDRISRAILDFGKIMEIFERYGVEFVSHTEKFDTSTPIGKAMLNIIMVFAQLERETIQQRITDNYYSRGEKGFYLGGYAPFGYKKAEFIKDGKKTCRYEKNGSEAEIVRGIYSAYADLGQSMNAIACDLNKQGIPSPKNGAWSQSGISRILRNSAYVRADAEVYKYLESQGAHMNNPISDYIGINGCYAYGDKYITLGAHEGIIPSDLWLEAQKRREGKGKHSNAGSGTLSWLQGLVKCRSCGYSCYVKKYKGGQRYFYCRGKRNGVCAASRTMMKCGDLEESATKAVGKRIKMLDGAVTEKETNPEINALKMTLAEIEIKIKNILDIACSSNEISASYINSELTRLDKEKRNTEQNLKELSECRNGSFKSDKIISLFHSGNIKTKKRIAAAVIDRIEIDGKDADIYLK